MLCVESSALFKRYRTVRDSETVRTLMAAGDSATLRPAGSLVAEGSAASAVGARIVRDGLEEGGNQVS